MWSVHLKTHLHGVDRPQFLTGCWPEASVLHHMDLFISCLSVLIAWHLVYPRADELTREKQRGKEKPLFFYNTISEVKCHLLCDISYSDFRGYRDGRDYTRVGKFHGWRSLVGYSPWDHKESTMPEQLHWFTGWIPGGGDTFGVYTGDRLPQEYRSALWQWGTKAIKIKAFFYWRIYLFSPQIKII